MDKSNVIVSLYRQMNDQLVVMNNGTSPSAVERLTMLAQAHLRAMEIPEADLSALADNTLPKNLPQAILDYKL